MYGDTVKPRFHLQLLVRYETKLTLNVQNIWVTYSFSFETIQMWIFAKKPTKTTTTVYLHYKMDYLPLW